jgi:hypothetical protein
MRAEYDFSKGKRGVFRKYFPPGATVVALDEDVRRQFPTGAAVNRALRSLAKSRRGGPRAHFDFATGKRGAFLKRFPTGVTLVALHEDVRTWFPTAKVVNKTLRSLTKAKHTVGHRKP